MKRERASDVEGMLFTNNIKQLLFNFPLDMYRPPFPPPLDMCRPPAPLPFTSGALFPRLLHIRGPFPEREFFIDNLLVRTHLIIEIVLVDRSFSRPALRHES